MRWMLTIALFLLIWSFPLQAQATNKQGSVPVANSPSPAEANNQLEAIRVLQAQLAAEKEHNQSVLNTVYWALSFVGGLALLLIGASWFNTRVVHDREIRSIQRQLLGEQSASLGQIKDQLTSDLNAVIEKDVATKLTQETGAIRQTLTSLKNSIKDTKHELKVLEHTGEIRYWTARDVPANVLMQYRLMLEDVKSAGDEYRISEALAGIQELLQQNAPVDTDEIPQFITAMSGLPDHFSVNVQAIRQLLAQGRD